MASALGLQCVIFKCFCGFSLQNNSFVKVRDVTFDDANALFYPLSNNFVLLEPVFFFSL